MARAVWSGSLSFGLVNIPVNMYSATQPTTLGFHLLRKEDLSPIKYVRVARADGSEVPYEDIVRGYEYNKGDYVVLTDDDFEKADVKKTRSIEIEDFVNQSEIDPVYFEKPYYLAPTDGAAKPYALLVESLKKTKRVGVARFVMRAREHIGIVRPYKNTLTLEQIRFQSELRPIINLDTRKDIAGNDKEIDMAIKLIDQMTEHFEPSHYKDTYKNELKEIINEKVEKGSIRPRSEEPKTTEFVDLMGQLRKSLEAAQTK